MTREEELKVIDQAYLDKLKAMYEVAVVTVATAITDKGLEKASQRFEEGLKHAREVRDELKKVITFHES